MGSEGVEMISRVITSAAISALILSALNANARGHCVCTVPVMGATCECFGADGKRIDGGLGGSSQPAPVRKQPTFTLITVTNQGEVFHAKGFDTLRMCEQAKSVATTGRTLEQIKADRKAEQEREAKRDAEWRAKHPPRKATAAEAKNDGATGCNNLSCYHIKDGMFYEDRPQPMMYVTVGQVPQPGAIKHAECVIEPPKDTP